MITYGANWEITGRQASIFDSDGALNDGFTEVSSSDLSVLPTAIQAASGKTYQSSETFGNNTDKTFYDSSGKVLGYSFSWSNDDGSSGTGYEDSDRNWLGDSFSDPANGYTSSFSSVEIKDSDGNVTGYQEKGTSKQVDTTTNDVLFERKWDFQFDTTSQKQNLLRNPCFQKLHMYYNLLFRNSFYLLFIDKFTL